MHQISLETAQGTWQKTGRLGPWSQSPCLPFTSSNSPHSAFVFVVPSPQCLEWLSGPCVHQGPWWHCCGALGSPSSSVPPLLRVRAGLPPPGHFLGWPEVPWNEFSLPSKGLLHSVNKVLFLMQDNRGVYFMGSQEDWASVACAGRQHVSHPWRSASPFLSYFLPQSPR